jgi:hypothetical protein
MPAPSSGLAAQISRRKRQRAKDKQVVVLIPPYSSQAGRGGEDPGQTPEIDRPVLGMIAWTLVSQHRNNSGNRTG